MNKAGRTIHKFLHEHGFYYKNPQKIIFIVNPDGSMIVNHAIKDPPQEKNIELGLCYTSDSYNDFLLDFRLANTKQLKALSIDRLWEMYHKVRTEVYCYLEVNTFFFSLYFRLQGNKMIVCDEGDNQYELEEPLQTPGEFVAYTRQQAMLQADYPHQALAIIPPASRTPFDKL